MTGLISGFERGTLDLVWIAMALATLMTALIVVERVALVAHELWLRRARRKYGPLVDRALRGDQEAIHALVTSPSRLRLTIARMLITPLVEDRDPARIVATRSIVQAMSLLPVADRFLGSHWSWRRVLALRALGLMQVSDHTAQIVAALDDPDAQVRNAALDALADLHNTAALPAVVVRLHDATLQRGRRAAALSVFGPRSESFLLELARIDPAHRLNYARALAICATERSRATLCEWTEDVRVDVKAAAFEALGHVGLDERAAMLAIEALDSDDIIVRSMAAKALEGWTGAGNAASQLGRHLDDVWVVALHAARALLTMQQAGRTELEARATQPGLAGVLAQQMLWEADGVW